MRLTILGSGTATPLLDRNYAGYLLEADNHNILFDSGAGTIRRLLELKFDIFEIKHIFYTHLHNDHINDLGAIIWSCNYGGKRTKSLNLYGPKGFKKYCRLLLKLLKPTRLNFVMKIHELKNSQIQIGNLKIKTSQIRHSYTTKSVAYRIGYKGKTLVYTGDAEFCEEVVEISKNANVLVTECSLPQGTNPKGHLTPSLAGRIASLANARHLVLTHFYPQVLKTDIRKDCRKEFRGKIILAKDKMRIKV